MDELDKAAHEIQLYHDAGGDTICEMSVVGIRRAGHTPTDLKNISKATGVHIISATGFYCDGFLPDWAREMSVRAMADFMMEEIVKGVDGVRCGVMYIGCSYPLKEAEMKALQAAAIVHQETGVSISIMLTGICPLIYVPSS